MDLPRNGPRLAALAIMSFAAACAQTSQPASQTTAASDRTPPPILRHVPQRSEWDRFPHPVVQGVITSRFGARRARGGGRIGSHGGLDIAAPIGTPVRSAASGRIIHAGYGYNGSSAFGIAVVVDHGDGWVSLYAHLSAVHVRAGQHIEGGRLVGRVGETGNATGPHVHIEIRHHGRHLDPARYITGLGAGV